MWMRSPLTVVLLTYIDIRLGGCESGLFEKIRVVVSDVGRSG